MDNIIFVLWLDEIIITVKLGKLFSITPQILCPICTMERIIPLNQAPGYTYIYFNNLSVPLLVTFDRLWIGPP